MFTAPFVVECRMLTVMMCGRLHVLANNLRGHAKTYEHNIHAIDNGNRMVSVDSINTFLHVARAMAVVLYFVQEWGGAEAGRGCAVY